MMHWKRSIFSVVVALALTGGAQSPTAKEAKYLEKGKQELQQKNGVAILHFKNASKCSREMRSRIISSG
jgi:hypothetical protein